MQPLEKLVEQEHLTRVLDEALVVDERRLLGAVEEVRMVGALAKLPGDGGCYALLQNTVEVNDGARGRSMLGPASRGT